MNKKTMVSFFSGGGGFDIGAKMAGYEPIEAYELNESIANVYKDNLGDHIKVTNILNIIIELISWAVLYHFSPPCPNFSNAKKGREETELDILLAEMICKIISTKLPLFVTLENVYGYRKSKSFKMICQCLKGSGYDYNWWHLNSANYGVPQTRKRLILIARRDGKPVTQPSPTHEKEPLPMFGLKKWIGWYEAIEDLIPGLDDSKFADWQLPLLPDWFYRSFLVNGMANSNGQELTAIEDKEPSFTVVGSVYKKMPKAFIIPGGNASTARAILDHEPINTIGDTKRSGNIARAFIMDAGNTNSNGKIKYRYGHEPIKTISSNDSTLVRSFIPHNQPNSNTSGRHGNDPVYTIRATRLPDRTTTHGRVVKLSIRCLSRLQSFPDWYTFPNKKDGTIHKTLSCTIIGNSVPPLLAKAICDKL